MPNNQENNHKSQIETKIPETESLDVFKQRVKQNDLFLLNAQKEFSSRKEKLEQYHDNKKNNPEMLKELEKAFENTKKRFEHFDKIDKILRGSTKLTSVINNGVRIGIDDKTVQRKIDETLKKLDEFMQKEEKQPSKSGFSVSSATNNMGSKQIKQ